MRICVRNPPTRKILWQRCVPFVIKQVCKEFPDIARRIEVPSDKNLQFFTLWVALGAGYFQQEGLEPKILVDASG